MGNNLHAKTGRLFYAIALLAISIIHLVFQHFPNGLLPVPATLPGKTLLANINGSTMVLVAIWMLLKPQSHQSALAAAALWLVLLLVVHLRLLLPHLNDGGEWASTLEVITFLSGALMIAGINRPNAGILLVRIGHCLLVATLIGFGILHYIYLTYITTLIPAWMPGKTILAWVVTIAFFAAALSLLIRKQVKLAMDLLSLMFFLWVLMLHLPRAIKIQIEPEWTSVFVALAMSGIAQLAYATTVTRQGDITLK
jgi:uncharacterized membrane protein